MIKLIILDWDDCITKGSSEGYYACYEGAIAKAGIQKSAEEVREHVRKLWGRPHKDVIASSIGSDNPLLDEVSTYYEELLFTNTFSDKLMLIPGAKEKLEALSQKYRIAIATGMDGVLLREHMLPSFDMQNLFSSTISSTELADSSRGKPFPDMVLKLLEEFGVAANEAIMVGDAKGDVLMAQAAGVEPIVVLTGQLTREEAEALGVTIILPDVTYLKY